MIRLEAFLKRLVSTRRNTALLIAGLMIIIAPSAFTVLTNTITFTGKSAADYKTLPVSANTLKPRQCDSIDLSNVVAGTGTVNGTGANDLLLASALNTNLVGGSGSDCLITGDGGTLDGGGPDTGDPDVDICIGGPTTVFIRCETVLQN